MRLLKTLSRSSLVLACLLAGCIPASPGMYMQIAFEEEVPEEKKLDRLKEVWDVINQSKRALVCMPDAAYPPGDRGVDSPDTQYDGVWYLGFGGIAARCAFKDYDGVFLGITHSHVDNKVIVIVNEGHSPPFNNNFSSDGKAIAQEVLEVLTHHYGAAALKNELILW